MEMAKEVDFEGFQPALMSYPRYKTLYCYGY
jgi:hypothetical protein